MDFLLEGFTLHKNVSRKLNSSCSNMQELSTDVLMNSCALVYTVNTSIFVIWCRRPRKWADNKKKEVKPS